MKIDETPVDWHGLANCRGLDPSIFVFQEPRHGAHDRKVLRAKKICDGCPVIGECLEAGIANNEMGVWGGKTEDERRNLKRRRRRSGVALLVGEAVPAAKLTVADVVEIRESDESQRTIAARYGVSRSAISLIRSRVNWTSVA